MSVESKIPMLEFAETAYEVITRMRVDDNREPARLRVSDDWPDAIHLWGIPVRVDSDLPSQTIEAEPSCVARQHEFRGPFVSKIKYGPPDENGRQQSEGFEWTKPGPRCIFCGAKP